MRSTSGAALVFGAILSLSAFTSAQTILPNPPVGIFPACALSCSLLLSAQNSCVPPAAPVSSQATYANCFCQSALLTSLNASPDGTCDAYCPAESDRQALQSWFKGYCASGGTNNNGVAAAGGTVSAQANTPATTPFTLSTITSGVVTVTVILPQATTSGNTAANTGLSNSPGTSSGSKHSWMDTHWRWILMLGILLVGLILIAVLAVYLKRRHRRKVDERRASASGFPTTGEKSRSRSITPIFGQELWGPHQHMAHTRGWGYSHEQDSTLANGGVVGTVAEKRSGSKQVKRERSNRPRSRRDDGKARAESVGEFPAERSRSQRRRDRERRDRDRERDRDPEKAPIDGIRARDFERDRDDPDAIEKI